MIGACAIGGILGTCSLPLLGFGANGVAAASIAAAWESSIGSVATGGLFATLQSLGATGMGSLLFGGMGVAMPLLINLAVAVLGWCFVTMVVAAVFVTMAARICRSQPTLNDKDADWVIADGDQPKN